MYCKKCGTEQKDGQKFCPKCGEPFLNDSPKQSLEKGQSNDYRENASSHSSIPSEVNDCSNQTHVEINSQSIKDVEGPMVEKTTKQSEQHFATEQGYQEEEKKADDSLPLSSDKEKKVKLTAKAGMWIILIAIVATFIRTGFGFSFWWYIFLLVFAGVALLLWGVLLPNTDADKKPLTTSDALAVKVLLYVGAAMFVILYLWGPLNSDYTSGSDYSYERSSNDSSNDIPKWLTEWGFICETGDGAILVKFDNNGKFYMRVTGGGHQSSGFYPSKGGDLNMNGTFTIENNNVNLSFTTGDYCTFKMDAQSQRLYSERGGVFKQTML